jgi:hypothetical protein
MKKIRLAVTLTLVLALILALVLALAVYAQEPAGDETEETGGIGGQGLNDPPPAGYTVLYMFTGATDTQDRTPNSAATVVHCTNYGDTAVNVCVEISDWDNSPVLSCTTSIASNYTKTFFSQSSVAFYGPNCIMSTPSTDDINQGSGRIMADSSSAQVICTAQVVDPINNPPRYGVKLALYDGSGNLVGRAPKIYLPIILKNS